MRTRTTRNYRPACFDARGRLIDQSCEFVYSRPTQVGGVPVAAGELVDKGALDLRRLRQMYDARRIQLAPGFSPGRPAPRPLAVGPTDMKRPGEAHPPEKKIARVIRRVVSRRAA